MEEGELQENKRTMPENEGFLENGSRRKGDIRNHLTTLKRSSSVALLKPTHENVQRRFQQGQIDLQVIRKRTNVLVGVNGPSKRMKQTTGG